MTFKNDWYTDTSNVKALALHLIQICELIEPMEVYWLFDKPWKWTREWCDYQESKESSCSISERKQS